MLAQFVAVMMLAGFNPSSLTVHAQELGTPQEIQWVEALSDCESSASSTVRVLDTNGKYSYGLLQFQMSTWLFYGKDYGSNETNIYNPALQKVVALSILREGGWRHWYNCGRKVRSMLGAFPIEAK